MVSVSQPWFNLLPGNSINLSKRAACKCIDDSGIDPCDIGLLINTGIYRHKNLGEPAIASLIQKKMGTKATRGANSGKTFSFDLNNGGCGWLTGIQIIEEFINSNQISNGMVVTGDSDPFHGLSEKYYFKSAAAAIILSRSKDSEGFALFRSYSFPDHSEEFVSRTGNNNLNRKRNGKNILYVSQKETYLDLCAAHASESLINFLGETGLKLNNTDLIISSQSPAGLISKMKDKIGMKDNFVEIEGPGKKKLHTSGPAFALKKTWDDKRFKRSKHTIFLTVGSGITVSVALYIN